MPDLGDHTFVTHCPLNDGRPDLELQIRARVCLDPPPRSDPGALRSASMQFLGVSEVVAEGHACVVHRWPVVCWAERWLSSHESELLTELRR